MNEIVKIDQRHQVGVMLPAKMVEKMKQKTRDKRITMTELIENLIDLWLKNKIVLKKDIG